MRSVEIMDINGRDWLDKSVREVSAIIEWSNCIVLCYDITDRHSFYFVQKLYSLVMERRSSYGPFLVVGNKLDLERGRNVDVSEGKSFSNRIDALFQEVSAAESAHMILSIFENLIQQVLHLRSNCWNKRMQRHPIHVGGSERSRKRSGAINIPMSRTGGIESKKSFKGKKTSLDKTASHLETTNSTENSPNSVYPSSTCVILKSESDYLVWSGYSSFPFPPSFSSSPTGSSFLPLDTGDSNKKHSLASHFNPFGSVFPSSRKISW